SQSARASLRNRQGKAYDAKEWQGGPARVQLLLIPLGEPERLHESGLQQHEFRYVPIMSCAATRYTRAAFGRLTSSIGNASPSAACPAGPDNLVRSRHSTSNAETP
ncbi:hypothetical protein Vafri_3517, partial [Volvox africanus]